MYRILIVEDDDKIAHILKDTLTKYEYEVFRAVRFHDIKGEAAELEPDLILLDINLPRYDGFYWCRQIRTFSNVPIIFLSARTGEMDQVMAIENGGDDYLTKPFNLDVVLAKVKGALRRAYGEYAQVQPSRDEWELNGLKLDRMKNSLEFAGKRMELTKNELLLFDCLAQKAGSIASREELLEALWDDVHFVDDNTLTVNVTRVRRKLEEIGLPGIIETLRGQGYRLQTEWGSTGDA
ncbi:response regulator transcription factor [Paenibacillus chitinolyticus]|uniref:response regulator transcription factor n=1 Tax=Paenibacillus chitinolyticus TaxID=79263 RepID=UPI002DB97E22|nr:response regulator transcription factor [Paenibacillus chitinolyticus]MEC0248618.1 response regulator transcription factor [Paenibacillus chitinolyticus]